LLLPLDSLVIMFKILFTWILLIYCQT